MDLATATNSPETVTLGGEEYRVRLLTFAEWGVMIAYLKKELPSPITRVGIAIDEARAAGTPLSKAAVDQLYDRAEGAALKWPPGLGTQSWIDALGSIDGGGAKLLHEVLGKTNPSFTLEDADALESKVNPSEWGDLIRVSLYGVHPRPKDKAAPSDPTPTP